MAFKRKMRLRNNRKVYRLVLLILVLLFSITGLYTFQIKEDSSILDNEVRAETLRREEVILRNDRAAYGVPETVEKVITDYMKTWYTALSVLQEKDVTAYFDPSDEEGKIRSKIDQTALAYLVSVRAMQKNDLKMAGYTCGITYTGAETLPNGDVAVDLDEDQWINFNFIAATDSYSSGIQHRFVLRKTGERYQIIRHEKEDEGYWLIEEGYEQNGDETGIEKAKHSHLKEAQKAIEYQNGQRTATSRFMDLEERLADRQYSRDAAIAYAQKWVDPMTVVRNPEWNAYDEYDGNCNNYISQCLYAGGIPMDWLGEEEWKWVDDEVKLNGQPSGRSPSWTGVDAFYQYAENNEGYGLSAVVDRNLYAGEKGDILQYGTDAEWWHSVIITDVVREDDGSVADYLIYSNTTDRINYPASAYAYYQLRLIHISGWNDE